MMEAERRQTREREDVMVPLKMEEGHEPKHARKAALDSRKGRKGNGFSQRARRQHT